MKTKTTEMGSGQPLTRCIVCNKKNITTTGRKICQNTDCVDTYWRCAALYEDTHTLVDHKTNLGMSELK